MTGNGARYRQAAGVPSRTAAQRVILARPGREDFDALTGPAVALWHLLEEPRSVGEVVEILAWAYDAPRSEVARDVAALVDDLLARGAIEGIASDG